MRQAVPWVLVGVSMSVAGFVLMRIDRSTSDVVPKSSAPAAAPGSHADTSGRPVQPVPDAGDVDPRKRDLGARLFSDPGFSKDGTISCASCHDLKAGGDDGRRVSKGVGGAEGDLNAPTVLNARFNFRQFWDGRAESLAEQVEGPILHPKEMASDWPTVVARIESDAEYAAAFRAIYADGITRANVKDAIAEFERSLVTPNSRFDRFLRGDTSAITPIEADGWRLFQELGCITCHQGVNFGGNSFQMFGVRGDYFADRGAEKQCDLGRFNVTKNPRDRHRFKVPTLRNVALTAPYFHDGSTSTLEDAVEIMARYQLGFDLERSERDHLVAFLRTLTGKSDGR